MTANGEKKTTKLSASAIRLRIAGILVLIGAVVWIVGSFAQSLMLVQAAATLTLIGVVVALLNGIVWLIASMVRR
jgi:hypothetical protein